MVIKVYISGISGNKEVKKHQQRVVMILDSKNIGYTTIDITEPGKEDEKDFMQQNSNPKDAKYPLPPQIFNEEVYCGDYEDFDNANELDELEKFLKLSPNIPKTETAMGTSPTMDVTDLGNNDGDGDVNGMSSSREVSVEKDYDYRADFAQISDTEVGDDEDEDDDDEVEVIVLD